MDKIVKEQHFLLCKNNIPEYVDLIMKDISEMDPDHILVSTSETDNNLKDLLKKACMTHKDLEKSMVEEYTKKGIQAKVSIPSDVSSLNVEMNRDGALMAYTLENMMRGSAGIPDYHLHVHWKIIERTEEEI